MEQSNESYSEKIKQIDTILVDIHEKYKDILGETSSELNVISDYTRNAIGNVYGYLGVIESGLDDMAEEIYGDSEPILKDFELKMNIYNEMLENEKFVKSITDKSNGAQAIQDYKEVEKLYKELNA